MESIPDFMRGVAGGDTPADAKAEGRCLRPPIGCGEPVWNDSSRGLFRDMRGVEEYAKSGLCQLCQDRVWALISEEDCE